MQLYPVFYALSNGVAFIDYARSQIFTSVHIEDWPIPVSSKNVCHNQNKTPTIIYYSIENFMGYKMMPNSRDKYTAFKNFSTSYFRGTMKNPFNLTLLSHPILPWPSSYSYSQSYPHAHLTLTPNLTVTLIFLLPSSYSYPQSYPHAHLTLTPNLTVTLIFLLPSSHSYPQSYCNPHLLVTLILL